MLLSSSLVGIHCWACANSYQVELLSVPRHLHEQVLAQKIQEYSGTIGNFLQEKVSSGTLHSRTAPGCISGPQADGKMLRDRDFWLPMHPSRSTVFLPQDCSTTREASLIEQPTRSLALALWFMGWGGLLLCSLNQCKPPLQVYSTRLSSRHGLQLKINHSWEAPGQNKVRILFLELCNSCFPCNCDQIPNGSNSGEKCLPWLKVSESTVHCRREGTMVGASLPVLVDK